MLDRNLLEVQITLTENGSVEFTSEIPRMLTMQAFYFKCSDSNNKLNLYWRM